MATTSNYGWTTPDDTDLVKNGALAIRTLGSAIDTTVYNNLGLIHINTTSFSAVASQSINDVFSATYDNYRIIFSYTPSTSSSSTLRLRNTGADATGANYGAYGLLTGGTSNNVRIATGGNTSWTIASPTNAFNITFTCDILNPNLAAATTINGILFDPSTADSRYVALYHTVTANGYDGLSLITSAGTISGSISVYGYRKS